MGKICGLCGKPIDTFYHEFHFVTGDVLVCADCRLNNVYDLEGKIADESKISLEEPEEVTAIPAFGKIVVE